MYEYDLRAGLNPITRLENKSCVKDVLFHRQSTNYLFSYDFSGEIALWDLRINKVVNKYFDEIDANLKCSIKLNKNGSYLYNGNNQKKKIYFANFLNLIKRIIF